MIFKKLVKSIKTESCYLFYLVRKKRSKVSHQKTLKKQQLDLIKAFILP